MYKHIYIYIKVDKIFLYVSIHTLKDLYIIKDL